MQIALADGASGSLYAPDDLIEYGRATMARVMPQARALICPHRHVLESPEAELITMLAAYLMAGVAGALVNPVAAYLLKRGVRPLCADWQSDGG